MKRFHNMVREAAQWLPLWGAEWAKGYLDAALIGAAHETDRYRAALEYIARCNNGEGHLPEVAKEALRVE
jgi:hypothetical protein